MILVGWPDLYQALLSLDEHFVELFKVKADFDSQMPLSQDHLNAYANFVAARCQDERLRHFDRSGVAAVAEQGARLVDDQHRLTARFSDVADLLREASYWAALDGSSYVSAVHVEKAAEEKDYRSCLIEERIRELIQDETLLVQVSGAAVGQVNGLGVVDIAIVGHHDRIGLKDSRHMNSWNSSHGTRGCSQENLKNTGGAGPFYCFAAN